ncbi:TIM barrel protein [Lacisediminihabitans profunda]|uniref:TIM barrel protein n=1 Tax=Lacisediminihabitans profunda TaxID=2594790 RepID=A0A5C8UQB6_9MICO|nr:TIM barrel protein [Lacisediminihabitans profunda]
MLELVANVSLLFAERPLLDRFTAAAEAGFAATELWWPFDGPTPSEREVTALLSAVMGSGIPLAGMNLWAGNMPGGERGVLSQPVHTPAFRASLGVSARVAETTGCRVFNALYGQRLPTETPEDQDSTALDNLAYATSMLGTNGGTVLLEPLSVGLNGAYPLQTVADILPIVRRVRELTGGDHIALLFDTFHLANNGEDLVTAIDAAADLIGHVQFADSPGRGEPGTGHIDFPVVLEGLWGVGYRGAIACEYVPTVPTLDTLGWVAGMPHLRGIA